MPLTSLLKIIGLLKLTLKAFKANNNKFVSNDNSKANKTVMNLSKNNKSKNLTYVPNIRATKRLFFLIPNVKKVFNYLHLAFIESRIL